MTDHTIQEVAVKNIYHDWCSTIQPGKEQVEKIIQFYAPNAILLPTLSPDFLINQNNGFVPYFTMLTSLPKIHCESVKLVTHVYDNMATNVGFYNFIFEENGEQKILLTRFTFVYNKTDEQWKIVSHHSSRMPA